MTKQDKIAFWQTFLRGHPFFFFMSVQTIRGGG